jgi:hypothetical protein
MFQHPNVMVLDLMYVKQQTNPIPLHWDAETLVTNYFQCNYWGKKGARHTVHLNFYLNVGMRFDIDNFF